MFVKPPLGIPGADDFYVPSYCNKCSKHFLIKEELEMHKKDCESQALINFLMNPKL